jgi:hypothetical protein
MISDARGGHVSPGVYTEEKDVLYSAKSLGITSLGLAGETVKGPAFQAIPVTDWADFVDYFGGTSTEKYKGTGLPKYELPYVAKEYLKESKNLNVVRVLGLSGYENGPAYGVQCKIDNEQMALVILRSKADYSGIVSGETCEKAKQEKFTPFVDSVKIQPYSGYSYDANCKIEQNTEAIPLNGYVFDGGVYSEQNGKGYPIGKFAVVIEINPAFADKFGSSALTYNVSLNRYDRDYIYNVFSTDPLVGSAPVFIEAVYDFAYNELVKNTPNNKPVEFSAINSGSGFTKQNNMYHYTGPVSGNTSNGGVDVKNVSGVSADNEIYPSSPKYIYYSETSGASGETTIYYNYTKTKNENGISEDATDYTEIYRCAQTPWVVSEVKSASNAALNLKKLFKVYTISDGNAANYQVKISIQRIRPDEGLFDLWVRDFYDTDDSPVVLEKYSNLTMAEGNSNYIGLKIGTFDGGYVAKSKYITVEISNEDGVESCVPCGFLGYPVPTYGVKSDDKYTRVKLAYNTIFDDTIKPKRQYFGLNHKILDEDILNYKGVTAYNNAKGDADPDILTNGFHLDAIISQVGTSGMSDTVIYVDDETGYTFTTVDGLQPAAQSVKLPRIVTESFMEGTIYEDINLRKFTVYPYGGFDAWDIYRPERTNADKYKASKYAIVDGCPFERIGNTELVLDPTLNLNLPTNAINSDYYAYLAGYRQFANPSDVYINLFATPGIDYANNGLLVEDALEVVEDPEDGRGGDALYVVNSPVDIDGTKSAADIVDALEESEINSSYACSYWPWIKYYDTNAKKYITLPVTKDAVRDMAATDNNSYPWFAPAGTERGDVDCIAADIKTTLADEDTLYEGRVNPIKTFGQDGVKIWGNKTFYKAESPLNRINVRRLMLRIKKLVVEASKHLIFEQNDATVEKQFRSLVEPILSDVKSNRGISDYRVQTESTPETRDQHILPAKIMVKPISALEWISISFVVYPESVDFQE